MNRILTAFFDDRHFNSFLGRLVLLSAFTALSYCLNAQVQSEKNICAGIERFTDDSSHQVKLYSPGMWNNNVMPVIFSKIVSDDTVSFSLYLSTRSDMIVKNGKGALVIFSDSTIWNRSATINTYPIKNSFEYNTVIDLTEADVILFSTKKIAKYMLYIFSQELDKITATNLQASIKCITESR